MSMKEAQSATKPSHKQIRAWRGPGPQVNWEIYLVEFRVWAPGAYYIGIVLCCPTQRSDHLLRPRKKSNLQKTAQKI